MIYAKVGVFLLTWYLAAVGLLFGTLHLLAMWDVGRWVLVALVVFELCGAIAMSAKDNFLSRCLGRVATFIVLASILWSSLPSMFYISMFLTGETL